MNIFIRTVAIVLLIGTTIGFILKVRLSIPISHTHLFVGFIVGAVSLLWTNIRESAELRKRQEELKRDRFSKSENTESK
jgi:phosphate/sulfate permease